MAEWGFFYNFACKMKDFLKYTLATITGLLITCTTLFFLGFVMLAVVAASSASRPAVTVKDGSVLVVKLSGQIVERAEDDPISELLGYDATEQQGLDEIVTAIDKAAQCSEIKGIYLEAGIVSADYASLQEIRKSLERFRAAGRTAKDSSAKKFIAAYGDEYTQGAYYVCSVADEIWINPQGMIDLHGLAAQPTYLKDLLEKVGVKMTVVKVGKYKSATEQYTETQMSEANREQVTRYVNNIWNVVTKDISMSTTADTATLNALADSIVTLCDTKTLKDNGLITRTMYANQVKNAMKSMLGLSEDETVPQVSCSEMCEYELKGTKEKTASAYMGKPSAKDEIAVYYCEGSIVQNEESGALMGDAGIVSKKMVSDLEELAENDDVKAVVIRINSGGGDAFASEDIWHAVVELKKKKPVVVSMGGMAASGAYYLSCGASWIVAQPTTLTGSIGIFGVFPDISGLMQDKLGIKYDVVKTNKHADMDFLQSARPFDAEEQRMLQNYIERGYGLFCKRVSDGRKLPVERVKEIAEGRVWTGSDALNIKLVDQLGGLPEAITKAAAMAKITEYRTVSYPTPASWAEQLFETVTGRGNNLDEQLRTTLGVFYEPLCLVKSLEKQSPVQARCPWIITLR